MENQKEKKMENEMETGVIWEAHKQNEQRNDNAPTEDPGNLPNSEKESRKMTSIPEKLPHTQCSCRRRCSVAAACILTGGHGLLAAPQV